MATPVDILLWSAAVVAVVVAVAVAGFLVVVVWATISAAREIVKKKRDKDAFRRIVSGGNGSE